jgi:hypothetical protein
MRFVSIGPSATYETGHSHFAATRPHYGLAPQAGFVIIFFCVCCSCVLFDALNNAAGQLPVGFFFVTAGRTKAQTAF